MVSADLVGTPKEGIGQFVLYVSCRRSSVKIPPVFCERHAIAHGERGTLRLRPQEVDLGEYEQDKDKQKDLYA